MSTSLITNTVTTASDDQSAPNPRKRQAQQEPSNADATLQPPLCNALIIIIYTEDGSGTTWCVVQKHTAERMHMLDAWDRVYRRIHHSGVSRRMFSDADGNAVARLTWASRQARDGFCTAAGSPGIDATYTAKWANFNAEQATSTSGHLLPFDVATTLWSRCKCGCGNATYDDSGCVPPTDHVVVYDDYE